MKLLFLLTVAIVLIGITTQASACNYERMSRSPNYARITTPKKVLNIPNAHGICIAPNGNFAVVSWNTGGRIYLYYACGKLMKVVDPRQQRIQGYRHSADCALTDRSLYLTDYSGKKVYEYSATGKFIRTFGTPSFHPFSIAACHNRFYITTNGGGQNVYVCNTNGGVIRRFSVPANHARGIIVGTDNNLYVSNWQRKQVYTYNVNGGRVRATTYKEIQHADGLAMDTAGNLLITDHTGRKVNVYSPCGALIKSIQINGRNPTDVEIGNDGTVMVADYTASSVYLY